MNHIHSITILKYRAKQTQGFDFVKFIGFLVFLNILSLLKLDKFYSVIKRKRTINFAKVSNHEQLIYIEKTIKFEYVDLYRPKTDDTLKLLAYK